MSCSDYTIIMYQVIVKVVSSYSKSNNSEWKCSVMIVLCSYFLSEKFKLMIEVNR